MNPRPDIRARAPGALPNDAAHPRLRERRRGGQPGRRERLWPGSGGRCPGARPAAPVDRPGGGGRGRLRPPGEDRLPDLHAPRPRPHAGQGRRPDAHDVRALRQGQRLQWRQGRLDAHRRLLGRHAGRQRRGRGRAADRGGGGACAEAAEEGRDHRVLLRRRRDQPRPLSRIAELGARLRPAGALRLRGQPLERDHGQRADDGRRRRLGPRRGAGHRGDTGGRQRRVRGACGRGRAGGRGARRRAGRGCCTRSPTA